MDIMPVHRKDIVTFFRERLTVDQIQFYISRGIYLHPLLFDYYKFALNEMKYKDKVSLLPFAILQNFNEKLQKTG